jgi:flagellar basal-body rod protein FlgG
MSDALSIAATGLKTEEYLIDRIAADLSNLNTPNYKATKITFEDVMYQNIGGNSASHSNTRLGLGSAIYKTEKDFSAGPLKSTNNWNDVAIDGSGFFQVELQDGSLAYTRNSTLSIDADRYLSTQSGLRLADAIQIPDDFIKLTIQNNGDIEVILSDDPEPQVIGSIQLAKFINPQSLTPIGSGLYLAGEECGDPMVDVPGTNGFGSLAQHQIENSNVDMVGTLMQLTMAQRAYQLNAKAVQIADELEKMTNELRS